MDKEQFTSLLEDLRSWRPTLVAQQSLRGGMQQDEHTAAFISRVSFQIPAGEFLQLTAQDNIAICKLLRKKITGFGKRVDSAALEQLTQGESNGLDHELAHLRVINQLRPELVGSSSINILFIELTDGRVSLAMNNMTAVPERPYTALEKAQIMLAPTCPSPSDYVYLHKYILEHPKLRRPVTKEEIGQILQLAIAKPFSTYRDEFTERVLKLIES